MLTKANTVAAIRALGLTCRWNGDEYVISFPALYYMSQGASMTTARERASATAYTARTPREALLRAMDMIEGELV